MAKRTSEEKLAEVITEALDNHWFNPALFAHLIVKGTSIYTQDKLMELMSHVIKYQAGRFKDEWEHDQTSEGLMLASHLAEVIEMHEPLI